MRLILSLVAAALLCACTHRAPSISQNYEATREGFAQAINAVDMDSEKSNARLVVKTDAGPKLNIQHGKLVYYGNNAEGSELGLANLVTVGGCWKFDICPDIHQAERAWILDNTENKITEVPVIQTELIAALSLLGPPDSQSLLVAEFAEDTEATQGRFRWRRALDIYRPMGDYICEFNIGATPPPNCIHADRFRKVAFVSPDMTAEVRDLTPDNLSMINKFRTENADHIIMVETLGPPMKDYNFEVVLALDAFEEDEFCGVFGEPVRPKPRCIKFEALQSVSVVSDGKGKLWGVGDYAKFPLRLAAAVGAATVMAGGGN